MKTAGLKAKIPSTLLYDPSAGFVTGSGTILSPEGAYADEESLSGPASFGFVSRYKKGQSTPGGTTAFAFQMADLAFASTSYQWLVIAGERAQFKGSGQINQGGDFGFLLTAIDGEFNGLRREDRFRIKIWDNGKQPEEAGYLVYDNQVGSEDEAPLSEEGTRLQEGSIVLHTGGKAKSVQAAGEAVVSEAGPLPAAYRLAAAYPNPFNPQTTIPFALPEAAHVRLVVYDVLGREVAVLLDGALSAGRHTARFEASRLPSGLYLVRMEAAGQAFMQRLTLVK